MIPVRAAFTALLFLALSGCVVPRVQGNLDSVPPDRGIVLFSTGAERPNGFSYALRLVEGQSRRVYDRGVFNMDSPLLGWDFEAVHARVFSLSLRPGTYYLVAQFQGGAYWCTTDFPVFTFEVEERSIRYIGHFQIDSSRIFLRDGDAARDMEFFRRKNPALASVEIQDRPSESFQVSEECNGPHSFIQGIIFSKP